MPLPAPRSVPTNRILLRDVALERIRDAIMDGVLEPGETLHDAELKSWLGISRTPIREALSELRRAGLVEAEANRYTRVVMPLRADMLPAMRMLGVLFGAAALLTIPRMPKSVKAKIENRLQQGIEDLRRGKWDSLRGCIFPAYLILVEHSDNAQLMKVCDDSFYGLAYKIPIPDLQAVVDTEGIICHLSAVLESIGTRNAMGARMATERCFNLPVLL